MFKRFLDLFRGRPTRIEGISKLPEGRAHKVSVGDPVAGTGRDVLLVNVGGEIHAVDNRCPHAEGFIGDGPLVEGKFLVCPLHNYRFDPRTGACVNAPCRKARRYRVERSGDAIDLFV
ncbi:MAG: Rieske (2Fe-2S) protein [Planctomycetota bacterium]